MDIACTPSLPVEGQPQCDGSLGEVVRQHDAHLSIMVAPMQHKLVVPQPQIADDEQKVARCDV